MNDRAVYLLLKRATLHAHYFVRIEGVKVQSPSSWEWGRGKMSPPLFTQIAANARCEIILGIIVEQCRPFHRNYLLTSFKTKGVLCASDRRWVRFYLLTSLFIFAAWGSVDRRKLLWVPRTTAASSPLRTSPLTQAKPHSSKRVQPRNAMLFGGRQLRKMQLMQNGLILYAITASRD